MEKAETVSTNSGDVERHGTVGGTPYSRRGGRHFISNKSEFRLAETSLTLGPERNVKTSSEGLGWVDIAATFSDVVPYEATFMPVSSLWLAMPVTHADIVIEEAGTLFKTAFQSNTVMIAPPAARPSISLLAPCTALDVFIRETTLIEVADEFYGKSLDAIEIVLASADRSSVISHLMHTLIHMLDDRLISAWRSEYVARCIAAEILVKHSQLADSRPAHGSAALLTPKQISRVRDFLEEHIDGDFSFASLANSIGLGRTMFFASFSRTTNQTPNQFLQSIRIERAKSLLQSSGISIADIAISCGFADQSHFSRMFKRHAGMTPNRYRAQFA